jgi:hypothetical protein
MSLLDAWLWFLVLGSIVLFALGARTLLRVAHRHEDDDPKGPAKALLACLLGLLLAAGSLLVLIGFERSATEGIHQRMIDGPEGSLKIAIGESAYQDALTTIEKRIGANGSIPRIILPKLAEVNATIFSYLAAHPEQNASSPDLPANIRENVTKRDETLQALAAARLEVQDAVKIQRMRTPNHKAWLLLESKLREHRDAEAERMVHELADAGTVTLHLPLDDRTAASNEAPCARDTKTGLCALPLQPQGLQHVYKDIHQHEIPFEEGGPFAFAKARGSTDQLHTHMLLFVYPSVVALLFAPLAFAGGSILRQSFVPSDTVGFRPYPGRAAGWFFLVLGLGSPLSVLLLPGVPPILDLFGLLALPLAALLLRDLHKRSVEGQIAL